MLRECVAIGREPRNEKTEGFRVCPASRKGNYESQLVESFKNNQSSQMACYEELFPARHVQAGIIA